MEFDVHGGGCCGISHIYNFPIHYFDLKGLNQIIGEAVDEVKDNVDAANENDRVAERPINNPYRGKFNHLIEIVLTDEQMMTWSKTLKERGFKLGPRWLNDNSGNYCNMLTWVAKKPSKPRPYTW